MRSPRANRQPVWVSLFLGESMQVDAQGRFTGRHEPSYSEPVKHMLSVSAGRGAKEEELFGSDLAYDRTVTVVGFDADEQTRMWIDRTPDQGDCDYVVKAVRKSVNQTVCAVGSVRNRG